MTYREVINNQYSRSNLGTKIIHALEAEGLTDSKSILKSLASIEDIHTRGRLATIELAQEIGIEEQMKVLDIGCGIGGPARAIAGKFRCSVIGIDLCKEYCQAAESLNKITGFDNKIKIIEGNILDTVFDNKSFDIILIQHVVVNIKKKQRLFAQIHKILKPNGKLAIYEICAGTNSPVIYPVVWADDSSLDHLISPHELRQIIISTGFNELMWKDETEKVIESYDIIRVNKGKNPTTTINYGLVIPNFVQKGRNIIRNLKEGRIVVFKGIFTK
ncbi:MAG: SAM-dependent methyltransferase [Promethearchaeota archaeon]